MIGKILIVDDEKNQRELIAGFLKKKGHDVVSAKDGEQAVDIFHEHPFDLVISDFKMKNLTGVEVLKAVKKINPTVSVILVSAFGTVETAVQAMKFGAVDFLVKPINLEQLEGLVNRALLHDALVRENEQLKERLAQKYRFERIIGDSGAMQEVLNLAGRAATSKATILIRGESGTGKDLLANAVHLASDRADGPFVEINCAALSPGLLESELFGHEKGAFTGADKRRAGRFEIADGGTLFIDEVGDIPLQTQVKLLNVIQSGKFMRVGGNEEIRVDVRIVAATHRDLETMIKEDKFREDLYFRLNVVSVVIPPLRERRSDIPLLIDNFVRQFASRNEKQIEGISAEAQNCLIRYNYPGNIRELENAIEQAVVLARGNTVELGDLPGRIKVCGKTTVSNPEIEIGQTPLPEMIEALEIDAIRQAIEMAHGVQTKAAEILGIGERNLRYKIEKYKLK